MRYSHGSGGPVAPLYAAMFAECYVEASVHQRLVGVVVVCEQVLLELALVMEDCLEGHRGRGGTRGRRGERERESRRLMIGQEEKNDRKHGYR